MSVVHVRVAVVPTIPMEAPRLVATHLRSSRPYRAPPSKVLTQCLGRRRGSCRAAVPSSPSLRSIRWVADKEDIFHLLPAHRNVAISQPLPDLAGSL